MTRSVVTTTLRNEIKGTSVPVFEPTRPELVRISPDSRVVICAVEVEDDQHAASNAIAVPFEVSLGNRSHDGCEGIEAPNFVNEIFEAARIAALERALLFRILMQSERAEDYEIGDCNGRPEDVDQLDGAYFLVEQFAA